MRTLLATLLTLSVAAPAAAGELQGVTLPDQLDTGGHSLVLNGMALRKVAFIKVYVAGLYLPEKATDADAVLAADAPRHMVMHWLRGSGGERICNGWMEGLEANTPNASERVEADFQTLCEWTDGAEKDDRFLFTYIPGEGTRIEVAGQTKGTIEGKPFADALFASWIGPDPGPGEKFKQDLMGGS